MKRELREIIYPLYEKLEQINPKEEYETFCAQWGEKYSSNGIMFVGRAVNDWKPQGNRDTKELFRNGSDIQIFDRKEQLKWVETDKYFSKSAFWRVVRKIAKKTTGESEEWYKHIVWSNLYKLSPTGGGNPSNSLCNRQFEICNEILKYELKIFKPRIVIFLTGAEWYYDFLYKINNNNDPIELEDKIKWIGRKEKVYEIIPYKIGNTIFIGSEHPQGKNEPSHISSLYLLIKKYFTKSEIL